MIDEKRIREIKIHYEASEVMLASMGIDRMKMPEYQALLQITMDGNWLLAEVERLRGEVQRVGRERDAAVKDVVQLLINGSRDHVCEFCSHGKEYCPSYECENRAEWRGMEESHGT